MADLKRAHYARLDDIMARWERGEIGAQQKRALIEQENQAYAAAGGKVAKRNIGDRDLPDPDEMIVTIMARARGVPAEQMRVALDTARQASHDAANADRLADDIALRKTGWAVAQEILHGPADAAGGVGEDRAGLAEAG
jgi:hypothetical protein